MTEAKTEMREHVETLIKRAAQAGDAPNAMQFAQAALNAARAMCDLIQAKNMST